MRAIATFLLALSFSSVGHVEAKPLRVVASDLIVESAEQGEFLDSAADPRYFNRSDVVLRDTGLFGWRMKVNTNRKKILVQERGAEPGQGDALPKSITPRFGYIYSAREIVQGVSPGKYSMTVYVEKVPVKTFTWTVK